MHNMTLFVSSSAGCHRRVETNGMSADFEHMSALVSPAVWYDLSLTCTRMTLTENASVIGGDAMQLMGQQFP